jgi:hypothetical protein
MTPPEGEAVQHQSPVLGVLRPGWAFVRSSAVHGGSFLFETKHWLRLCGFSVIID